MSSPTAPRSDTRPGAAATTAAEASHGSSSSSSDNNNSSNGDNTGGAGNDAPFQCNICFEQASDPVVSLCGHLYCWPCIHQWIESQAVPMCPVCKAGIGKDKVIPVYCRGKEASDPRQNSVPNRPQGQRPQPERQNMPQFNDPFGAFARHGHYQNTNFHFSMGFGLFPSLFGLQFAFPMEGAHGFRPAPQHQTQQEHQQQLLSRAFLFVGILMLLFLLTS